MSVPQPTILKLAICLYPQMTPLDYQGAAELFSFLSPEFGPKNPWLPEPSSHLLDVQFVAHTTEKIIPSGGPKVSADRTFAEIAQSGDQYDAVLVPGGPGGMPGADVNPDLLEFLKKQAPGCKYVMSVCTGSWVLAKAGLLNGKKATTNKATFNAVREDTKSQQINWIPKARWVVDGNTWTASGVTAGLDMAAEFLKQLVGETLTTAILGVVEHRARGQGDDEFADFYKLDMEKAVLGSLLQSDGIVCTTLSQRQEPQQPCIRLSNNSTTAFHYNDDTFKTHTAANSYKTGKKGCAGRAALVPLFYYF